ncbi:MAG: NAD(P)-binding domain-containing protein [Candidatus Andersenbacteria bacterium]
MHKHKLAIIGSGVVGQATGKGFNKVGKLDITFVDVNDQTIQKLREEGYSAIRAEDLTPEIADVLFISVPTPTVSGRINLDYLIQATINIAERVLASSNSRHTIVVRSTVPPGTTEKLVIPLLEENSGKVAGKDFGVSMSPEYLREETAEEDFIQPRLITVGALDDESAKTMEEVYAAFNMPVHRLPLAEAEAQKYVHNLYNACKISFFNEMRMVCSEAGINAEEIFPLVAQSAEACWNPTYGTKNKGPFSGSCLPKDTTAFLGWARDNHKNPMQLLDAVIAVNEDLKSQMSNEQQMAMAIAEKSGQRTI